MTIVAIMLVAILPTYCLASVKVESQCASLVVCRPPAPAVRRISGP